MGKLRVAICEDDINVSNKLEGYVNDCSQQKGLVPIVSKFYSITSFLDAFHCEFDIILMDIEFPDGNGMVAVEKLRKKDKDVIVIFVTNMAQFAVKGYEVRAFDFIVKPVTYFNFCVKFFDAIESFKGKTGCSIWVADKEGGKMISSSRVKYVEIFNHQLVYHTTSGEIIANNGSLSALAERLKPHSFSLCNRCYLVNLRLSGVVSGVSRNSFFKDGGKKLLEKAHKQTSNITKRLLNGYYYTKRFGAKSAKSATKQIIKTLQKLNFGKGFWKDWLISGLSSVFSNSFSRGLNGILS